MKWFVLTFYGKKTNSCTRESRFKMYLDYPGATPELAKQKEAELIKIEENRRNYDKVNQVSSKFIRENERQEQKRLISAKKSKTNQNPVQIVNYFPNDKKDRILTLYEIINHIISENQKKDKDPFHGGTPYTC